MLYVIVLKKLDESYSLPIDGRFHNWYYFKILCAIPANKQFISLYDNGAHSIMRPIVINIATSFLEIATKTPTNANRNRFDRLL